MNDFFYKKNTRHTLITNLLQEYAKEIPDHRAFTWLENGENEAGHLSFKTLDMEAKSLANRLRNGISPKPERALLLYPQGLDFIIAFMGCLYAGVVAVPINFLDPKRFVRNFERFQVIAKDAKADTVLSTSQVIGNITKDSKDAFHLSKLQWIATDKNEDNQAFVDNLFLPVASEPDNLAFIQYTSGSTSKPKGIMISYKNLSDNSYLFQKAAGNTSRDCMVNWAPHFHDMGLVLCILQSLFSGMHCVQMSPLAFVQNPYRWLKAISDYKATISCAPNFGFELCMTRLKKEQLSDLDLSSWKVALNGAETIYSETLQRFAQMFAPCGFQYKAFFPVWGLAEATVLITSSARMQGPVVQKVDKKALAAGRVAPVSENEAGQHIVGCGRPFPGLTVVVVNPETRRLCQPDEIGEIWAQCGDSMPEGYWDNPEANEETYGAYLADTKEGPFLRTGDFGFMLNGEFFFSSRLKDLIVIRGVNYYPQDIELFVHKSHDALRPGNGAAFPVVQDKQECLVVINELKKGSKDTINTKEIIEKIRQDLSQEFAIAVHAVVLIEPNTILKTSSGKIRRQACRTAYIKGELSVVDDWHSPKTVFKDQLSSESRRPKGMTREEIEQWITSRISEKLGLSPELIDSEKSFVYYGLDSIMSLEMTEDLSAFLKRPVPADSVYNYPTIASLAKWLDHEDQPIEIHFNHTLPVSKRPDRAHNRHGLIAIVGMACRFPGANDISSYWDLLADGKDGVSEVPNDRWDIDAYYDPTGKTPGTMNTRWGGFIDGVDMFDARFFDISPEEAAAMDPQQRLFLETSWEALEHAGQINSNLAGSATGVFAGVSMHDYDRLQNKTELNLYIGTGNTQCIIANRVSHFLGLQGPSMTIDTACSSSLVSVHLAMNSLKHMECDLALAGGVNLVLDPDTTVVFSQAGFLSPTGRCKTFDSQADGYIRSEGCGVVVLKRYADAIKNKDNILAVLRGSAVNQDGFSNGLTAPNGLAQQSVIRKALADAGVSPQDISYIEAHGTGTPLGDPIEANAIEAVFANDRPESHPLWIGSAKTNIGHAEAAAGIAGLIKIVLSLQHRRIPPHLHLGKLNPMISLDKMNGIIPQRREPWGLNGDRQRCAGISSFGFGGTNAHVIVSEAPTPQNAPNNLGDRPFHLFTLSALTKKALYESARQYITFLETSPQIQTGDICFTVNTGRRNFPHRLATCVSSNDELKSYLEGILQSKIKPARVQEDIPKIAFLFTGQGAQYRGMGQQLYETQPEFRKAIVQCDQIIQKELDTSISTILYKGEDFLDKAIYIQPALFALEYALARMWISWGVFPQAVMGHSIGEYVAACVAGIVSPEDGIRLVLARARLMHGLPQNGKMAAIFASGEKVEHSILSFTESVSIAAFNGPQHIVISGKNDKIDKLVDRFNKQKIACWYLDVSHGFHSPLMDPILDEFEAQASAISYSPAKIPFVSNLTGNFSKDRICEAKYWREHLRNPVRFASGVNTLHQNKFSVFLEIGPRSVLSGMAAKCLPGSDHMCLTSLKRGVPDWQQTVKTLGKLYLKGTTLNFDRLEQGYDYKRVPLPTYPFERQSYWTNPSAPGPQTVLPPAEAQSQTSFPLIGRRIRTPLNQIIHEVRFDHNHDLIREHLVYNSGVMSGSTYIEMLLEILAGTSGEIRPFLDNIVVQAPMSVGKEESRTVQLVLDQQNEFKVFSSDSSKEAWTLHLTGQVRRNGVPTAEKYNESVDAIQSRCSKTQDAKSLYEDIKTTGLDLGPQYQWMEKIWYNDNEALVLMRQPCHQDLFHSYQIHPGLIDSCAQSLLAGADFDKDAAYMFLGYDTYRFLEIPALRLWCHTRFKEKDKEIMSGDYDLFAEDGALIASARGVYAKRAPAKAFFGSGHQTVDQMFYHFEWVEQPLPENDGIKIIDQQETWIIFADASSQSQALLRALDIEKINGIQVVPGTHYTRRNEANFRLNPSDPKHFRRFFSEIGAWQHILYLWGLADDFSDTLTKAALKKALSHCCGGLLHLVQAIGDTQNQSKGDLWCLTRNAHPFIDQSGRSNHVNPVQTSLWGLARVIDNEMDNFHTHLFDLPFEDNKKQINHLINEIRRPTHERQVALCSGKRFVPRLVSAQPCAQDTPQFVLKSNQTYVVTGGAGGLGQELMAWLVGIGARHLVLVGKNDLPQNLDTRIRQLSREGADISYSKADVTQSEEIRSVLNSIPELGGIFHLAGTLDDGMLLQKDWAGFEKVMAPKTLGSWNLHRLTQERKNSFLVMFSSIASFAGIPGQADYATANAFMDGLVSYRHHKGLSGTGINWGPWADVGMAASHVDDAYWIRGGMKLISGESGFDLMKRVPENNGQPIAIVSANWKQFAENILRRPIPAIMSRLVHAGPAEQNQARSIPEETAILSEIQNATDADKQNRILSYIRRQVEKTIWFDSEKQINLDAPLMNIGFDSLKILELRNRIRLDLNTELSLSQMIKNASILKLSQTIAAKFGVVQSEIADFPQLIPDHAHKYEPFPLTDVQHAYWIGRDKSFELGNNACHVYLEADFKNIDLRRLNRALNHLIAHHDMLRAIILPDGRQQIRETVPAYDIDVSDLRKAADNLVHPTIEEIRARMSHQMLPADQWPLFEIKATLFKDGRTRLHISFDLLIGDGGTFNILTGDLFKLYNNEQPASISISYRDYVLAEKSLQSTARYQQALAYWKNRNLPSAPDLPLALSPSRVKAPKFVRRHTYLKKNEWDSLRHRGTQAGLTPSMILLAAFAEILRYWSKSPEFTINLSLFNRLPLHPEIDKLAGDFTSLIPLAFTEKQNSTFEERALTLQQQLWNDMEHRIVSGVQVLRQMSRTKNSGETTFPVVFTSALPYTDGEAFSLSDHMPFEVAYCISQTPQVWIDHQVMEKDGELVLVWDVVEALFPKGVVKDMFNTYVSLLQHFIHNPSSWKQTRLDLLPESQAVVRETVNATQTSASDQLLHALFFEQADRNPDHEALITSEKRMTYRELALRAEQIGQQLQSHKVQPDELVAVVMEKGWEQVVAVLGILYSGAAYVPVDAAMPQERLYKILKDGKINHALTQTWIDKKISWPTGIKRFSVDQINPSKTKEPFVAVQKQSDLAYVIYTSGSTGQPKGVMIDHKSAVNTILDVNNRFHVSEKDKILALSELNFDLSVYDIFGTMAAGGILVIPDAKNRKDPAHWHELIEKEQVTVWNSAPQLMQMYIEHVTGKKKAFSSSIDLILLSGDWIPLDLPEKIKLINSDITVVSLGGATEASIWSICHTIKNIDPAWKSIPYGRPMANQKFYVFNEKMEDCPDWVPGQLYIAGEGLARGYWADEKKTKKSFFHHVKTGEPLYKTGDLGRYRPDGNIEFLGRDDFQVKIRGHRIELGEIETTLTEHPKVKDAVVLALGEKQGPKILSCFVLTSENLSESGRTAEEEPVWDASILKKDGATLLEPMERLQFKLRHPGFRSHPPKEGLPLPSPERAELIRDLSRRTSMRQFSRDPILWEDFSRLITGLMGKTFANTPFPKFSYGSAGGLYPVQTYIMVKPGRIENFEGGLYYYHPLNHCLLPVSPDPGITSARFQSGNHLIFQDCAFALFLLADMDAVRPMYGCHARDFCLLEAGALTHHLETLCFDCGIGLCQIGGLDFTPMGEFFDLKESHEYLHCLLGGKVGLPESWNFLDDWESPEKVPDKIQGLETELVSFLEDRLPVHMIPTRLNFLESFPLTANGKVDRKALGRMDVFVPQKAINFRPPKTPTQESLARALSQATGVQSIGLEDSFFELGGDSLMAVQLTNTLKETFKVDLPLAEFVRNPTLAELAQALDAMLEKERPAPSRTILPSKDNAHEAFPLTEIQQAYWIGRSSVFELGRVATHFYLELENPDLDIPRLNRAWQLLVDRHPMLRAVILPDGTQKVLPEVPPYRFQITDLGDDPEVRLAGIREEMSHQMLPVDTWPLFDIRVSRLEGGVHRLHISMDALIMDAWSSFLIFNEWYGLYRDETLNLPPLTLTFRDYALAADQAVESQECLRSKTYWRQRLSLLPLPPRLPLKIHPAALTASRFTRRSARLNAQDWKTLKIRAARSSLTPSGVLIAAYAETLARWSRNPEMTINVTLFNRPDWHPEINDIIGDFSSLVPLGITLAPDLDFTQRAAAVQEQLWMDMDHRHFGGIRAIRELAQLKGTPQKAMLPVVFTSALSLEGVGHSASVISRLGHMVFGVSQTPQVWLDNQVMEQDGALVFNWDALEALFPRGLLDDMFDAYCQLLERLARDSGTWKQTNMDLLPSSQSMLWETFNATESRLPGQDRLLHTLFLKQAARDPDQTAVVHGRRRLSYGELSDYMFTVSAVLRERGAGINTPVAVMIEKGWEQVAAVLGILQAGAPYLPVDIGLPENRIHGILKDAQVSMAMVSAHRLLELQPPPDIECIPVGTMTGETIRNPKPLQSPDDLAYMIYTSGTTGSPKGVMISHRGAVNTILDINRRFKVGSKDRVLALSALSFDLSVFDIFGTLAAGGTLVIPESSKDPGHWLDLMKKESVTLWNTAPALMQMLTDHLGRREEPALADLRLVLLSGDWIPKSLPDRIRHHVARAQVISLGGATEASIWSVFHPVEGAEDWDSIPYGRPLANQRLLVLNHRMERCPLWVPGDLYIGGEGLLKGYWRDAEKTRQSLIVHPETGETLYRTGDLARMRPQGLLEFLGREDHQVKINGHRVELGEIESQIRAVAGIRDAVVTVLEEGAAWAGLVAYILSESVPPADTDSIRAHLKANLPSHMIPRHIQLLKRFPVTVNGKVDRKRLPRPEIAADTSAAPDRPPQTETERTILAIWADQLNMENMTVNQDYFECGGDSLKAVRIIHAVRTDLGVEIPLQAFFENPTTARLARLVDDRSEQCEALALEEGEI